MKTLQILEEFKNTQDVFLLVRKANSFYQLYKSYNVLDIHNNYVSRYFIHSIKKIRLNEIDNELAILCKNTDAETYKNICREIYKLTDSDVLYKMVFSTSRPRIDYA